MLGYVQVNCCFRVLGNGVGKFHKRNPRKIFNFVYSVRDIGIDGKNVLRIRAGSKGRRPSVAESRERFRHC